MAYVQLKGIKCKINLSLVIYLYKLIVNLIILRSIHITYCCGRWYDTNIPTEHNVIVIMLVYCSNKYALFTQ